MSEQELLEELQRIASQVTISEEDLRQKICHLSATLVNILRGIELYAESENVTVWELEPTGDFCIGHFYFTNDKGIRFASYEPMHCLPDPIFGEADQYEPSYSICDLDKVPTDWLKRAVRAGRLSELLQNLWAKLNERLAETNHAAEVVSRCLSNPTLAIGSTFTDVAQQIGYTTVVQDWKAAVIDIATDPASAIGRACSLTESVCKHLLDDLGTARPSDQSIHPLFKTTAKALGLDPAEQAEQELRGLCGGLATVAQHLGALRTKFSTAHGRGPDDTPLTPAHARLAVNAAGNISTFLMEVWQLKKETNTNP